MRTLCNLALCAALCGLAAACSPSFQTASVANLSEATVIRLAAAPDPQKHVVSLLIRGTGSIDGSAQIELMLNGKPYRTEQLRGGVSFTWGGDWYSPVAEIHYRPIKVQGGKLDLQYRFETL